MASGTHVKSGEVAPAKAVAASSTRRSEPPPVLGVVEGEATATGTDASTSESKRNALARPRLAPLSGRRRARVVLEVAVGESVASLLTRFRVIFRTVQQHNEFVQETCGISVLHIRALASVVVRPGIGVQAVADMLMIEPAMARALVDELAAGRLIARKPSGCEPPSEELRVTPAGLILLGEGPSQAVGVLPDAIARLGPAKRRRLERLLDDLVDEMSNCDAQSRYVPLQRSLSPDPARRSEANA